MDRDKQATIVLYTQPEKRGVERLVTIDGREFMYCVSLLASGAIRSEFNPDTSSLKARIGKVQRPGKPAIRRKD